MSWEGFTTQLGEVKDAYLDPLFDKPDSAAEILQKIKDRELGIDWWEEETRKLKDLKDLIPEKKQQQVASILSQAGDSFNKAWKGAETVENWTDPGDVVAAGAAHTINFANSGIGLFTDGLTAVAHHGLRLHKPVAGLTGTAASMYLTPRLLAGTGRIINRQIAISKLPASERVIEVKSMLGNQIPSETSASVLGKKSIFRKGSVAESRALEQWRINRALEGDPTSGVLLSTRPAADAGAISDLVPKVHNVTGLTAKRNLQTQLGKWLRTNEAAIHAGVVKPSDFGKIIYNNQAQRLSSEGWKNFLAAGENDYSKLEFRKISTEDTRELQADPGGIEPLNQNITRMNQAFIDSKGEVGLNPEHLNPQIFRKSITYAARKIREMNKIIRKELGLNIQQEHSLGLAQGGTDDAMGFFLGSGPQNLALNALEDPDAFTAASAAELNIPGKANVEAAGALKGQTKGHEIRRQEYLQQGWLESLSNWGIKAKEIGGNPFEAYNKILLQRKKDLLSGKEIELRMPGSNVTMTDMIRIQQLGFKMDRVQAAQTIMAERAIVDASIAAGVTDTPKGLALLEKYIKHIDIKVEVQRAAKAGIPFKEPLKADVNPIFYEKTILPSEATGRLGNTPTAPLPQSDLQKLKSKLDTK